MPNKEGEEKMKADQKIAQHRLGVLELAEALGNISEACRNRGMTRTQFYEYKRRFQEYGFEGLKDLPPIAKNHPFTIPDDQRNRVIEIALRFPSWGCQKYEKIVEKETGIYVSNVTIQKILIANKLGSRYQRWLELERRNSIKPIKLSKEQIEFLEKMNPVFKERHVESKKPGELLNQDTFLVGSFKGVGKVYLHAVVDTYSSYAFGFLHVNKKPEGAVAVLHNDVLPFYKKHRLRINNVLTDNGREYCGKENHPYELYLELNDIQHRNTKVRRPQSNGFIERFNRTVLDEFFRVSLRQKRYDKVSDLQKDLDKWLIHYNTERPHLGYRNHGRTPWETIQMFLKPKNNSVKKGD